MNLSIKDWKDFEVSSIMTVINGKWLTNEEVDDNEWTLPVIQWWESNNWVLWKINKEYCIEKNYVIIEKPCLTVARVWSAWFVAFQPFWCAIWDKAKALLLKDGVFESDNLTPIYLFIRTILQANSYRYSYWRS